MLAFSAACRHPGTALAVAAANYPDQNLRAAVLIYVAVNVVVGLLYAYWHRNRLRRRGDAGVEVGRDEDTTAADGSVLPFPTTPSASTAGYTLAESTHQRREEVTRLPADAPNILIVLRPFRFTGRIASVDVEAFAPGSRVGEEAR